MIDVRVSVSGIIMCCDESLCDLNIGRGYSIEKNEFDTLFFLENITNGRGDLDTDYYDSRIVENEKVHFICVQKDEEFQINGPKISPSKQVITDEDCMCKDELEQYVDKEAMYLNNQINLLRLFRPGNIGFRDIFFEFSFSVIGIINNKINICRHNQIRNTIATSKYTLSNKLEVDKCNQWLNDYCNAPYELLKNCIEEFSWGLEQIDDPTGFEQYTTALEMALLPENQSGKKQMLANRISALLGCTSAEVQQMHQKISDYYRFRSESLHEGDGSDITNVELHELENITREVLKKCLICCKTEYDSNPSVTWKNVKDMIMNDVVARVTQLKNTGVLPS